MPLFVRFSCRTSPPRAVILDSVERMARVGLVLRSVFTHQLWTTGAIALLKMSRVIHVEELLPLLDVAGRYERDLPHRSTQGFREIKDTHRRRVLKLG